ncbi:hypothetical protein KKJ04_20010 [Xenorhabdus bovienii]|uniref:hypothetical protein n=1 Tax=Xenorhabdus bovienii TaxID=40576 RepID=UPI0023B32C20|nr:hypothetical protein [Xenorhabdus bovienii]MDE9447776.1 hypothetical protein [Xenorhabdus bovienii]
MKTYLATLPDMYIDNSPYWAFIPVLNEPIKLDEDNVYITKKQLAIIYNSITKGISLSEAKIISDEKIAPTNESDRVTAKQSTVIVSAFKELGITENDMKGSINQLRQKIARKAPGILLPDDKTIIDWLRRGGISR